MGPSDVSSKTLIMPLLDRCRISENRIRLKKRHSKMPGSMITRCVREGEDL
jgi:hypothetical protein